MESIKKFIKKYWILIFLGALATIVVAIKFFYSQQSGVNTLPNQISKPSPTPILSSLSRITISGKAIPQRTKFSADTSSLPNSTRTLQGEKRTFSEKEAVEIAQRLGFNSSFEKDKDTVSGTFYRWMAPDYYLALWTDSPKIDYMSNSPQPYAIKTGELPTADQAQSILVGLLQKLNIQPTLTTEPLKTRYFKAFNTGLVEINSQEGDFIQVERTFTVDNYQLLPNSLFEPSVFLRLNRAGQIIRFVYTPSFKGFSFGNNFSLKNQSQILKTLTTEGAIVDQQYSSEASWSLEFASADFNQISLAYLEPTPVSIINIVQPIYVLSGTGTLSNGQQTPITAFLPAINYEGAPLSPAQESKFKF